MKIELDAPNVGELEKKYSDEVIKQGFVSTFGPFVAEFEKKVADYLEVNAAVAVQSGTAAIYIALYELGIGPGDEVIVPALTFTATVNPVLCTGATPVIVDVDSETWNIDPVKIREVVTDKTKAVIPVHLYGNPCRMSEIMDIAKEHNLFVVEDAAESLGATFNSRQTGAIGDFGCLSFNGNKLITTGGGGMVAGNDAGRINHIRYLVNQAKDADRPDFHSEMGFNYRMTNVEAAFGLAQFEKIDQFLQKKRLFKKIYLDVLGNLPGVRFQSRSDGSAESGWFTCIKIDRDIDIPGVIQMLKEQDIPTRRIFLPLNEMPYLKEYSTNCSNAYEIYHDGLCLPCSTINKEKDIREAALIIREVLNG